MTKPTKTRPHLGRAISFPPPRRLLVLCSVCALVGQQPISSVIHIRCLATDDLAQQAGSTPHCSLYGLTRLGSFALLSLRKSRPHSMPCSSPIRAAQTDSVASPFSSLRTASSCPVPGELRCILRCTTNVAQGHVAGLSFIESSISCSIFRRRYIHNHDEVNDVIEVETARAHVLAHLARVDALSFPVPAAGCALATCLALSSPGSLFCQHTDTDSGSG
jgi:hypothetical protein